MAELIGLKRQRSVNKGKLTYIINSLKKSGDMSIEECKAKIHRVEKLMDQFTQIENQLFVHDPLIEVDSEYEENYYKAITQLNILIREKGLSATSVSTDNTINASQAVADVRLPKLNVPTFSGDYTEWQSFHDLFVSSIHDSTTLLPVQKLQYLKGLLRGEAASLLRHFSITENNYIEALQKLRQRYDRKRHTMNAFIRTFIDQPSISHANNSNIKKLLDTSDEILRGLKAMGPHGEDRDPWLIYLLVNKLDDESKGQWAQETAQRDFPTIQELFDFLLRRVDALDTLRTSTKRGTNLNNKPLAIRTHVTTNDAKCPICEKDGHSIYQCPTFNEMNVNKRREFIKDGKRCFNCLSDKHPVFRCLSKRRCLTCRAKHHTMLHLSETVLTEVIDDTIPNCANAVVSHNKIISGTECVLPTAVTEVFCSSGHTLPCRALLDSGSQVSFITEACLQRLGLPRQNGRISIKGIGQLEAGITKGMASIRLKPKSGPTFSVNVFVLNRITRLPHINVENIHVDGKHLQLADPAFYNSNEVDLLIGIDHFFNILIDGKIQTNDKSLSFQNTVFGWICAGSTANKAINQERSMLCGINSVTESNIDATLKRFWELESIPTDVTTSSPEEVLCEKYFKETLQRNPDGRFQVRLPFKKCSTELGSSLGMAIQRLKGIERRFIRDNEFHKRYIDFMNEYLSLGHMHEIPYELVKDDGYFLPHHGVIKRDVSPTKFRVVFDGSATTSSGVSLNDCLAVGPTIQASLYAIILRFREHRIIFAADIEKMYRQVQLHDDDTNFQKIVWRNQPSGPLRYFKLKTVTYGLASAPFLATRALQQIADDTHNTNPTAAKIIESAIYVDDLMTGGDTLEEVQELKRSIRTILSSFGFNLKKWVSNVAELLEDIPLKDRQQQIKSITDSLNDQAVKILGLQYHPTEDVFKFRVVLSLNTEITKRSILSEAGKVFDPLGWISPVNIKIKIFIQQLWLLNLTWDDPLPQKEANEWKLLRDTLPSIEEISIPRFVHTTRHSRIELHGFCDASQLAYGAVVYYKVTTESGETYSKLVSAKTKVAPLKQQSLPRLELCGAVLLTNLMNLVSRETKQNISEIFLWTDSTIVLDWLTAHPRRWSTFIANRTSQILSSFSRKHWRHVPSNQNPADSASRGLHPQEIKFNTLWWNGPKWLLESTEFWPPQQRDYANFDPELNSLVLTPRTKHDIFETLISKCSSFHKLQRIVAYCLRFCARSRKQDRTQCNSVFLTRKELYDALFTICKYDQRNYFEQEVGNIQQLKHVKPTSNLKSLNPFLDNFGVLRVGGRLEKCDAPFSTKHPIILSAKSTVTSLILAELHRQHKHAGPSLLLALSRQQYWIPGARSLIRQIIHKCVACTRQRATCESQLMGNLPSYRLELVRPFLKVGVDYAGPLSIHLAKGRGQKTYKSYICLFICLSTKAVHIELVSDLSSDAFLATLKRFIARRGCCEEIYSDNGSNFIGADNQLKKSFKYCVENSNDISHFISRNAINWHFIPPNAPHFGGIWESAIKSTKFHLRRVIGDSILTMEEMITLLAEIESILNSRPLCVLSTDEIDALTPSHFLIGQPSTKLPEYDVSQLKPSHLSRWQMVQYMAQHFWKRWQLEYVTSLQQRQKWVKEAPPLTLNDIVIIKDENLPVNKWLLGKIILLHPGSDGLIRVVTMRTKNGELKRPITKVVRLPIEQECSRPAECLRTFEMDQSQPETHQITPENHEE